jgi:putative transposase
MPQAALPVKPHHSVPVAAEASAWDRACEKHREVARQRYAVIKGVLPIFDQGVSLHRCATQAVSAIEQGNATCKAGKAPSVATVKRWLKGFKAQGMEGLLPAFKGRSRKDYGWEARAIELFNIPGKSSYGDVTDQLRMQGYQGVTYERVKNYLKTMPATLGRESPARIGKHEYHLTHKPSRSRDCEVLNVGEIYQGDGHTIDCYLADPNTGNPYRPELTVWIDVRSRYIVGWYLSEAESAHSTLFSLCHALLRHDHRPTWLHIDNGSGFINKLMSHESIGFYKKMEFEIMKSIPGNPRGKGQIERWFRTLRDKHDKFWNNGRDYCGHDMAAEVNRRMSVEVQAGRRELLPVGQYRESLAKFVDYYNNRVHSALDGQTPAQLWETLVKHPVVTPASEMVYPRTTAVVRKFTVRTDNRWYRNDILMHYDGQRLTVEYSLTDDATVKIYNAEGGFICDANLVDKTPYLPSSRLEQARQKRETEQVKRLERHIEEKKQRAVTPLDQNTQRLEALETPLRLVESTDPLPTLDNTGTDAPKQTPDINILDLYHDNDKQK